MHDTYSSGNCPQLWEESKTVPLHKHGKADSQTYAVGKQAVLIKELWKFVSNPGLFVLFFFVVK